MAARARRCLRLEHGSRGPRLTVLPSPEPDHAMRRDGITPGPAGGRSQLADRTRLMLEIVSRTPLGTWTEEFGLTAAQIAAVPAGDWAPVLLIGWSRAAIAQRDQDWMAALVNRALTGATGRPRQWCQEPRRCGSWPGTPTRRWAPRERRLSQARTRRPPPWACFVLRFRYHMLKELDDGLSVD